MDREEIRLECLKLVARGGLQLEQVVATAKAYETFVVGPEKESSPKVVISDQGPKVKPTGKQTGKPDIFS